MTHERPGLAPGVRADLKALVSRRQSLMLGASTKCSHDLRRNRGRIFLGAFGAVLLLAAYIMHVINPLELILNSEMSLREGSYAYKLWQKPPVTTEVRAYIFNVTNAEEFLKGGVPLKVEEIGPYTYEEVLENTEAQINKNGTVSYRPRRQLEFCRKKSVGDPYTDTILVPNIVLLGVASMFSGSSGALNFLINIILASAKYKPFIELTVQEFLWGYNDPLIAAVNKISPKFVDFNILGIFDRTYNDGNNLLNMKIGRNSGTLKTPNGTYNGIFTVNSLNGSPGLHHWGYGKNLVLDPFTNRTVPEKLPCNSIEGTLDGVLFPRNLSPNTTFRVYRKAFCRTLKIVFDKEDEDENGIKRYWYKLPKNAFSPPDKNPENSCYCDLKKGSCLPDGLGDITPCYFNVPAAVSLPHFYNGDPSLSKNIEGLNPQKEKHESFLTVQKDMGIPMKFHSRIQTNIIVRQTRNLNVAPFNGMIVPLFWIDFSLDDLPDSVIQMIELALFIGPIVQQTVIITLSLIGFTLLVISAIGYYCSSKSLHRKEHKKEVWNKQYLPVKIVPSEKTEIFISRYESTL